MVKGKFKIGSYQFKWEFQYSPSRVSKIKHESIKLHFGPGPNWEKPDSQWLSTDVDPKRGDIVLNFNEFDKIPLMDNSVSCIYGSHIFEHISIFSTPKALKECFRVLKPGGYFRLVLPDVKESIEEYLNGNYNFPLFQIRINFLKKRFGHEHITLFEALKGDFISPSG